ncbi:MAG TPA: glycosyltransferase family 2 protein [Streptosporangiaceae bacterium]|nr:glycosyltransferase family 2 protein [Streptosporangiaceae bacterium]
MVMPQDLSIVRREEYCSDNEFSPVRVMQIELAGPLPAVARAERYNKVWVLGRVHGEPIGTCMIKIPVTGLTPGALGEELWREFERPIRERFAAARLPEPAGITSDGLSVDPAQWPFQQRKTALLAAPPFITVLICTRDRPDQLANCLQRLDGQQYPNFEVVVVENVPRGDTVRVMVEARQGAVPHRYLVESQSGLCRSRNTGIAAAASQIVAFLDDDAEPDPHWLAGIASGFARGDDIGCVSGAILPARIDTPAQELFEWLGGHSKDRGFSPIIFSRDGLQSPLFPLPPFGAGANLAFRRAAFEKIGGFDVALGAGTPARAGADTLAITLILLEGYRIAYEPAALMWHHHRRDITGLREQLEGYSVGLSAYYTALLRHRPGVLPGLLKLTPSLLRYLRGGSHDRGPEPPPEILAELNRRHARCMISGPFAYFKSMRLQARLRPLSHETVYR